SAWCGVWKYLYPGELTSILSSKTSISTPSKRKISTVRIQSSPNSGLYIVDFPDASELNIIALCVIDLSPGTSISPTRGPFISTVLLLTKYATYFLKYVCKSLKLSNKVDLPTCLTTG